MVSELHKKVLKLYGAVFEFAENGFPIISDQILEIRKSTCHACIEWDNAALNNTGRCRKCGCSTWAKLRMATERCPLGKWEACSAPPRSLSHSEI
jgi:hypothetical protein